MKLVDMTAEDRELEADGMARETMQTTCSDCGHTCGEDAMVRHCDGWRDALKESREAIREQLKEEKAELSISGVQP